MSYLLRTTALRSARLSTPSAAARFSTSLRSQKSAVDATKETIKKVDRTVSDGIVSGIEKGEQVSQATKSTIGVKSSEAKAKGQEVAGEAKAKGHEVAGEAKGKAAELEGKAKATKEEAKSKM